MDVKLKVASSCELYERDATIGAWADKSGDDAFIQDLAARSDDLKIVGVVQPKEDVDFTILTPAVYYSNELQGHLMGISKESAIVKEQIADPKTNVLTGKPFGEEANAPELDNLFSVDENAISNAFGVNESAFENMIPGIAAEYQDDFAAIQAGMEQYLDSPEAEAIIKDAATEAMSDAAPTIPQDEMQALMDEIMNGYAEYAAAHGYTDPTRFNEYFAEYMSSPEVQAILTEKGGEMMGEMLAGAINSETSAAIANKLINGYAAYAAANGLPTMESLMGSMDLSGVDMSNLFYFDADAFANAFSINMDADSLSSMLTSFMAASQNTYDSNLRTFGYSDESNPYSIYIYPKDFESKGRIKDILTDYNDRMKEKGDDDKVIVYTDMVEALMSSVTNVINAISYILIAFVSISLIVSSIMIGVITYISVLERMKEIGILRAIGASKRNISEVFNAETVIIGALAGVIGVVVSLLLLVPINMVIDAVTENITMTAALPPLAGVLLVILSIILTLIGGLIPSRKAANSDPVTALRID
jgi:putative ABC transport system permease protein